MEIRTRLRQVRKTLELTQVEFPALAGVQANALVLYEAGKRTPRSPFFARLNEHGIDVNYILYGTSETRYAETRKSLLKNYSPMMASVMTRTRKPFCIELSPFFYELT